MTETDLVNQIKFLLHATKCAGHLDAPATLEIRLTARQPARASSDYVRKIELSAEQTAEVAESLK